MPSLGTRLCDLGLRIAGSSLEPIVARFLDEIGAAGIALCPDFYLSTEWGVRDGSASLAIPFYLARADLIELHRERTGLVEGVSTRDILRYLRHEMGHIIDYVYKLNQNRSWRQCFGRPSRPYREEYRPHPFSPEYVIHLPGFYAQKHPQEDWAETCAVYLTPGRDWRQEYAGCGGALHKLTYCEEVLAQVKHAKQLALVFARDEDIETIECSLDDFYAQLEEGSAAVPPAGMAAALDAAFAPLFCDEGGKTFTVADLIRANLAELCSVTFRLTGHFPNRVRPLLGMLADTAAVMDLRYASAAQTEALLTLTSLVGAMAMNFTLHGSYQPSTSRMRAEKPIHRG